MKKAFSCLLCAIALILASCKDDPLAVTEPFKIGFLSIADSVILNVGEEIPIKAYVSNPSLVKRVDFFVNGQVVASDEEPPYEFTWKSNVTGIYTFWLSAVGSKSTFKSEVFKGYVTQDFLPVVTLTQSGTYNLRVYDTLYFYPEAFSPKGSIVKIDFFENGILTASDSVPPFDFTWIAKTPGTFKLKAVAWDDKGKKGESPEIAPLVRDYDIGKLEFYLENNTGSYFKSDGSKISVRVSMNTGYTPNGVTKTEVYCDNSVILTNPGYSSYIPIDNLTPGLHRFFAKAVFINGIEVYSDSITINIIDGFYFSGKITDHCESGSYLYLIDELSNTLVVANKNNTSDIRHYQLPFVAPSCITISEDNQKVYIGYSKVNKFSEFDISTKTFRSLTIPVTWEVNDIELDDRNNLLYILTNGTFVVYDMDKEKAVDSLWNIKGSHLRLDNDSKALYILETTTPNKLHKYSLNESGLPVLEQTNPDIGTVLDGIKDLISFSHDNTFLYFVQYGYKSNSMIEISINNIETISNQVTLDKVISGSVITSDNKYAYVVHKEDKRVCKYNLSTNSIVGEYKLPYSYERVKLLLDEKSNRLTLVASDGSSIYAYNSILLINL